jgi:mono/diheme cytochrome c family protein
MPRFPRLALLTLVALAPALAAGAAEPGGEAAAVAAGRDIAMNTCAWCHTVGPGQEIAPSLRQPTPSFAAIANGPKASRAYLTGFIRTTHWDEKTTPMTMPGDMLNLSDRQADEVVSYILSLRTRR